MGRAVGQGLTQILTKRRTAPPPFVVTLWGIKIVSAKLKALNQMATSPNGLSLPCVEFPGVSLSRIWVSGVRRIGFNWWISWVV